MSDKPLKVIAGTPDKPLVIGDVELECYVLEGETRVLTQGGFVRAIGRTGGPKTSQDTLFKLPVFLQSKNLSKFISDDLVASSKPIQFQEANGRFTATGYRATLLTEVCNVYLAARAAGVLHKSQEHIAERAEILIRGLAEVGIIGLVDEATGYQDMRARKALAEILEKFIDKNLHTWTKTFPYEFYEQIFRLKQWPGPDGMKKPSVIGHYTNDIVYERLGPGILDELKRINPTIAPGRRRDKHFQWFTPDFGHPKLREHLAGVLALMKASKNWTVFQRHLRRIFPKQGETFAMPLFPLDHED